MDKFDMKQRRARKCVTKIKIFRGSSKMRHSCAYNEKKFSFHLLETFSSLFLFKKKEEHPANILFIALSCSFVVP